jgi:hypothetical protein
VEEITEKIEMRLYAKIGFTQVDEDRKMQYAIGTKVNKGNAIVEKKFAHKRMRRKTKSLPVEVFKHDQFPIIWI